MLFPYLIGDDLNSRPDQSPSRWVINFVNWDENKCRLDYPDCFEIVKNRVKPERDLLWGKGNATADDRARRWWQFARQTLKLYNTIAPLKRVLVNSQASKYISPEFIAGDYVFDQAVIVLSFDRDIHLAIFNSFAHTLWSEKYRTTIGGTSYYLPSKAVEPFPFLQDHLGELEAKLELIGEAYHHFRKQLMLKLKLGLTKTYNQFHNPHLDNDIVKSEIVNRSELQKTFGKETVNLWNHLQKTDGVCSFEEAVNDIIHLRQLHKEMDETVLKAYGWQEYSEKWGPAIDLAHDFYEVDYLPENDRVRYTISPEARKEVLKRLLLLNHEIYEEEVKQGLHGKKKSPKATAKIKSKIVNDPGQGSLFSGAQTTNTSLSGKTAAKKAAIPDPSAQKVSHPTFGQGIVLSTEGHGDNAKLTIQFGSEVKKCQAKFVTYLDTKGE